jgi:branched-chain amino acid transport system permease protein
VTVLGKNNRKALGVAAFVLGALAAPYAVYPVFLMKVMCFALFACAFNLLLGYVGLLSFGHAAFFGSASYITAHTVKVLGFPPEVGVLAGTAFATLLGVGIGWLAIRRSGIYFAMITLGLAQVVYFFSLQLGFTGGEDGIQGVPRGELLGFLDLTNTLTMYHFVLVVFLLGVWVLYRTIHSPFGQVLKAIREDEPRAISLGYDVDRYKLLAFVLSAALSGLAGGTKSLVFQLASLSDVHWHMSGEVVLMTLLGGMGTAFGPLVGALLVVTLNNYLAGFGSWVTIIIGGIFVACVLSFRRGIVGEILALGRNRLDGDSSSEVRREARSAGSGPAAGPGLPSEKHRKQSTGPPKSGPCRVLSDAEGDLASPTRGVACGVGAYLLWGFFPLYFKTLAQVPPAEVLAHRILWAALLLLLLVWTGGGVGRLRVAISTPRTLGILLGSTALICINWFVFLHAVATGQVLESSLGYFITPLVSVFLGFAFLRERLRPAQAWGVALAALAVGLQAWLLGRVPVLALILAVSFGGYGLLRKLAGVEAITGLAVETTLLSPVAVVYMVVLARAGHASFLQGPVGRDVLLVLSGVVTATPLLLYGAAVGRLRLATVGLLQYLVPTLHFLTAVFVFAEPFTAAHLTSFALIWVALTLYAGDGWRAQREAVRRGRVRP